MKSYEPTISFAKALDQEDPWCASREQFLFPQFNGEDAIYLCGNSLGLQPKNTAETIQQELDMWSTLGVEGHFKAKNPLYTYHELVAEPIANLVGAKPTEVVSMNTLTVNLHLMMVSFYRPTAKRYKILVEGGAFPSDVYAIKSQIRFHGFDPDESVLALTPREGEHTLRTEDILATIDEQGDEIALILIGGVNYLTGQAFEMQAITQKGHEKGCLVGFDLAHAIGNITMELHDWGVDFAVWCTYKYLNSGPGSIGGCFVHEKHIDKALPRFNGRCRTCHLTLFRTRHELHL